MAKNLLPFMARHVYYCRLLDRTDFPFSHPVLYQKSQ